MGTPRTHPGRRRTRALGAAALLTAVGFLGACAQQTPAGGSRTPSPSSTATEPVGCPQLSHDGTATVSIDYVDFIQANGVQYLSAEILGVAVPAIRNDEIGAQRLTVTCSLTELNARTGRAPALPLDGNAGILPTGTKVYEVRGWPTTCRLAAQRNNRWQVYLATDPQVAVAKPAVCVLPGRRSASPTTPGQ